MYQVTRAAHHLSGWRNKAKETLVPRVFTSAPPFSMIILRIMSVVRGEDVGGVAQLAAPEIDLVEGVHGDPGPRERRARSRRCSCRQAGG